jgi:hypothetical protein
MSLSKPATTGIRPRLQRFAPPLQRRESKTLFLQRNKKLVAAKAQVLGTRLFLLRLPGGQRLSEFILEFGTSFLERAIEEIVPHVQPALFVRFELVDIAVFEHAFGKR